jgi:MFS family permease
MLPVTVVYFCYGWTLWLYINWLPQFFQQEYNLQIMSSARYSSTVFAAGVVGDYVGGVISDSILRRTGDLRKARRNVIVAAFLSSAVFLVPIFLTRDLNVIVFSLAGAFFCAELVIGPIWAIPMDIAPKYSGTASGFMNTGSAVAAVLSPLAFGYLADLTGNWHVPFIGSLGLLVLGAGLAFFMRVEVPFQQDVPVPS